MTFLYCLLYLFWELIKNKKTQRFINKSKLKEKVIDFFLSYGIIFI